MRIARRSLLVIIVAALALSALCGKYMPVPFFWIFVVWAVAASFLAWAATRAWARATLINVAAVFATLAIVERWAFDSITSDPSAGRSYSAAYKVRDDVLGTAPARGLASRSTLTYRGRVVYDTVYTIGPDGLRIEPSFKGDATHGCVLFFGDSVTFGEGLHDDETMPYRVALELGDGWRVFNFSFHGYGAQHMLAALEHGRVDNVLRCAPTHVVYQAITDHSARAAGLYAWTQSSPHYELQPDGSVVQRGRFDDAERRKRPSALRVEIDYQLGKSFLMQWFASRNRPVGEADVQLWGGIVVAAQRFVERRYPGAQFDVLLWSSRTIPETYRSMRASLARAGIRYHLVDDILPGYPADRAQYEIDAVETHPNARANAIIADYVTTRILNARSERP